MVEGSVGCIVGYFAYSKRISPSESSSSCPHETSPARGVRTSCQCPARLLPWYDRAKLRSTCCTMVYRFGVLGVTLQHMLFHRDICRLHKEAPCAWEIFSTLASSTMGSIMAPNTTQVIPAVPVGRSGCPLGCQWDTSVSAPNSNARLGAS